MRCWQQDYRVQISAWSTALIGVLTWRDAEYSVEIVGTAG
jgi:hypothetical protein